MKIRADYDSLLTDVLCEAASGDPRARLLEETLNYVGRRRRVRLALQTIVPLLVLGLGIWSAWWSSRNSARGVVPGVARCRIINTQPLPVSAIVTTQHLDPSCLIVTTGFAGTVRTIPGLAGVQLINDAELLAFAEPRPAILVRVGLDTKELIFVDRVENILR